jgi:tRNA(Ile2) C34 agmatinyltransferase TiaS
VSVNTKNMPKCDSCNSEDVNADASFGYDFKSCASCGYTIESTVIMEKIPKHLWGVHSEEAYEAYENLANRETKIWMVGV